MVRIMTDEKLSRQDVITQFRTKEIVDAAIQLVNEGGFAKLTVEGVAGRAGVAKGTIYLYFKDKDELIRRVLNRVMMLLVDDVAAQLYGSDSLREKLRRVTEVLNRYAAEYWEIFRFVHHPNVILEYHHCEEFKQRADKLVEDLSAVFREGMVRGEIVEANPDILGAVFLKTVHTIYEKNTAAPGGEAAVDTDLFIDLLFNGISKERETSK